MKNEANPLIKVSSRLIKVVRRLPTKRQLYGVDYRKKDEANAYTWIMFLVTLVVCALFYIVFAPLFTALTGISITLGIPCGAGTTCGNIYAIHEQWPVLLLGGMLLWVFVRSIQKEPTSGYY